MRQFAGSRSSPGAEYRKKQIVAGHRLRIQRERTIRKKSPRGDLATICRRSGGYQSHGGKEFPVRQHFFFGVEFLKRRGRSSAVSALLPLSRWRGVAATLSAARGAGLESLCAMGVALCAVGQRFLSGQGRNGAIAWVAVAVRYGYRGAEERLHRPRWRALSLTLTPRELASAKLANDYDAKVTRRPQMLPAFF